MTDPRPGSPANAAVMTDGLPVLPGVLADIAEVAGRDGAIRMALQWGGLDVHLPKAGHLAAHPEHPLAQLLGVPAAARVAQRVGGASVYIPMAHKACAAYLAAGGAQPAEIAARLGIALTTARRYARSA